MKKLIYILLIVGIFLSGMATEELFASGIDRVGTCAASQLLVPVGARNIALGGSSIALSSGIEAIFWNPAGIARSGNNADMIVSWMDYIADIGVNYFAVSGNFSGFGSLAFGVKSFSFGDIPITTEEAPDGTGGTFSPTFFTAGLTYARQLTDRVFIGATLNIISEKIQRVSATGVAINVGVQYHNFANIPGFNIGVVVKDVGTEMKYDGPGMLRYGQIEGAGRGLSFSKLEAASFDLPSTIELGISYSLGMPGNSKVLLSGVFQNNNYASDEYRVGAEYSFGDMVFLRGGSTIGVQGPDINPDDYNVNENYLFGLTFGGGLKLNITGLDMELDYAYRGVEIFTANHVFGLKIGF